MIGFKELKEFAGVIAPETTERPLYLLDCAAEDAHPAIEKHSRGRYGWTTCINFDENEAVDAIGDDWRGPGRLIVMDTRSMLDRAGLDNFDELALAVMIHELAHTLPWRHRWSRKVSQMLDTAIHSPTFTPTTPPAAYPLGEDPYHGVAFARNCAHLWARAKAAGYEVSPRIVLTEDAEDQLLFETVIVHCAGEFISLKDKTFADIALHPMPPRLVEQWADNIDLVKRWEQQAMQRSAKQ